MVVTGARAVSTQNAAGDHVKESSHRASSRSSSSSSSASGSFTEETSVLTKTIEEKTVRQGNLAVEVEKPKFQLSEAKSTFLADEDSLPSWMAVAPPRRRSGKSDRGSSITPSSC